MTYASRLPAATALDTAIIEVALVEEEAMDDGGGETRRQNLRRARVKKTQFYVVGTAVLVQWLCPGYRHW
jgi:hypothetical protein